MTGNDAKLLGTTKPEVVRNICGVLKCKEEDLTNFEKMSVGLTNSSYAFQVDGTKYVYRIAGAGTEKYLDRKIEHQAEETARKLGLDATYIDMDPETGWKISYFINDCKYIEPFDDDDLAAAMEILKKLHGQRIVSDYNFECVGMSYKHLELIREMGNTGKVPGILKKRGIEESVDFEGNTARVAKAEEKLKEMGYEKVLCHQDTWFWNFLKAPDGTISLIDWEYCGNNYPASDVSGYGLLCQPGYDEATHIKVCEVYEGHKLTPEEYGYYMTGGALIMWYWFVWSVYQETIGIEVEEMNMWYIKALGSLKNAERAFGLSAQ